MQVNGNSTSNYLSIARDALKQHRAGRTRYKSTNDLYRCYGCNELFPAGQITREKKRGHYLDSGWCSPCNTSRQMAWRERNATHYKYRSAKIGLSKYGLSVDDYIELYELQSGKCAVCGKEKRSRLEIGTKRQDVLHVDHCHTTGQVRGLLCKECNHAIGLFKDDPQTLRAAASYLERS